MGTFEENFKAETLRRQKAHELQVLKQRRIEKERSDRFDRERAEAKRKFDQAGGFKHGWR